MCFIICRRFKDGPHWRFFSKFPKKLYLRASQKLVLSTAEQKQQCLPMLSRSWLDACFRMVPHGHSTRPPSAAAEAFGGLSPSTLSSGASSAFLSHVLTRHISVQETHWRGHIRWTWWHAAQVSKRAMQQSRGWHERKQKRSRDTPPSPPRQEAPDLFVNQNCAKKKPRFATKTSLFLVSKQMAFW